MSDLIELEFTIIEDAVSFTDDELKKMGIAFIEDESELQAAASFLMDEKVTFDNLDLFGLTVTPIGTCDLTWAIHKKELSTEYAKDIWNKNNFYTIKAHSENLVIKEIKRAYLRSTHFNDDLKYYIDKYFLGGQLHEMNIKEI